MSPPRSAGATAVANALCIFFLVALSIATYAYERTLLPLYGSAATKHHLNKVVWGVAIVGMFTPTLSGWTSFFLTGTFLCAMPQTAYWAAVYSGRLGSPIWGPVYTHLAVLVPMLYCGFSVVKVLQKDNDTSGIIGTPMQAITLPVCRMAIVTLQDLWPLFPLIREADDRDLFVYIGLGMVLIWTAAPFLPTLASDTPVPGRPAVKARGMSTSGSSNLFRIALLPLLPYVFSYMQSPTLQKPLLEPFTHPTAALRILSSVPSAFSGVITVGEIPPATPEQVKAGTAREPHSLRYLRAGHSLLGGVWAGERSYRRDGLGPLGTDSAGAPIGDSIYGAFVTQEAVRLVETTAKSEKQNALFIGLGTGIAASAFIKHGISSTIIEIDPAVYEAATKYFGLAVPDPEQVVISDGRGWIVRHGHEIAKLATDEAKDKRFDYVVHDCFSGGSVPGHMFTKLFWEDLTKIMKPEGVVAVNFAGKLQSESLKAILFTIQSVFPQCRAFHDSMEEHTEESLQTDFVNWVFFCSQSNKPISFRPAVEGDFLQSFLRERVLSTITQREINLDTVTKAVEPDQIKKYILTDQRNPLVEWQDVEALHHWKLMRDVLPDVYWETY